MKKILLIVVLVAFGFSCKVFNFVTSNENLRNFSVSNNIILYKNEPFARLQAVTYTIETGDLVKEMNFKLLDKAHSDQVENMIYFLSEKHSEEVEVEIDIDTDSFITL